MITIEQIKIILNYTSYNYNYAIVGAYKYENNCEDWEIANLFSLTVNTVKTYYSKFVNNVLDIYKTVKNQLLKNLQSNENYYAYILDCSIGIKVGYTNNIERRLKELQKSSKIAHNYEIIKTFTFTNSNDALEMEVWLHRYYEMKGVQVGNDHFLTEYNNTDDIILETKAEEIIKNSKKWLDKINELCYN